MKKTSRKAMAQNTIRDRSYVKREIRIDTYRVQQRDRDKEGKDGDKQTEMDTETNRE